MATLHLVILKTRKNSIGKYPIFIAVTEKREVRYIKTDYLIDEFYEFDNGLVVCRKDANTLNQRLKYVLSEYQEKLDSISNPHIYRCSQLVEILKGKQKLDTPVTVKEYMDLRIKRFKKEGREGYADMNTYTLDKILSILGDITLQSFSPVTIDKFINGMAKLSNATKQMRLCHLKACINEAIREGVVKYEIHPFAYTKMPRSAIKQVDISIDDFIKIRKFTPTYKRLELAKDLFLLSFYLGGINLVDIMNIDFSGNELHFIRKKTRYSDQEPKSITFTMPQEARIIVNKYITKNGLLDFQYNFSYKNFQCYLNKCLKMLATEVGIKTDFCFYSARKTFAQFASDLGIPDNIIDYCLGHSDKTRGVIRYYVRIKQKKADIAIRRVIDYTNNPEDFKDYIEMHSDIMMMRL